MLNSIVFCVTNDLTHDQRMDRICHTVSDWGYDVLLIGRKNNQSKALQAKKYRQKRLNSLFESGKLMYLEFNIRLFFKLLSTKAHLVVAIDLDTIAPVYVNSLIKGTQRLYDAHELFTELKEVVTRPMIQKIWLRLEQFMVPRFPLGMTVSDSIAKEFERRYNVQYGVVRNIPLLQHSDMEYHTPESTIDTSSDENDRAKFHHKETQSGSGKGYILYQGAVNEGRCLEWLIPAMKNVDAVLWICGDGNFTQECRNIIKEYQVQDKVFMKGMLLPEELKNITKNALIGINLVEPLGLNQIYSLANKFFDYIHAGIPQITMNFPEYSKINADFEVALLIDKPTVEIITNTLNKLLVNGVLYERLRFQCLRASKELNWQKESQQLIPYFPKK